MHFEHLCLGISIASQVLANQGKVIIDNILSSSLSPIFKDGRFNLEVHNRYAASAVMCFAMKIVDSHIFF